MICVYIMYIILKLNKYLTEKVGSFIFQVDIEMK